MKIRWMKHVVITLKESKVFLFNTFTDKLRQISEEDYRTINSIMEGKMLPSKKHRRIISELYEDSFIVDAKYKETKSFMMRRYQNNFFSEECTIYYIPTLECNFRCPYCFEKGVSKDHNEGKEAVVSESMVLEQVIWIKEWVARKKVKKLRIIFFGGEPMLGLDRIQLFIELLAKNLLECKVEYSMITNGYLFSKKNIGVLKDYGLSSVQITIDGPRQIHDQRRVCSNGTGTFDTIMNNIKMILSNKIGVVVRINIDESNAPYIIDLLGAFKKEQMQHKIRVVIAPIDPRPTNGELGGHSTLALSYWYGIYQYLAKEGFYCVLWKSACGYGMDNLFAMTPDGNMYVCPRMVGILEHKIGDIKKGFKFFRPRIPKLRKKCKNCHYLGVCVGGCDANTLLSKKHFCYKNTFKTLLDAWIYSKNK